MADTSEPNQEAIYEGEFMEADIDFRRVKQTHEVAGYREGMEAGKEAHLQQGFNQGFGYGVHVSMEWGKLRGVLSALLTVITSKTVQDSSAEILSEVTELLKEVNKMEKDILDVQTMQNSLENSPRWGQQCPKGGNNKRFKANTEVVENQRTAQRNSVKDESQGAELSQAFEMLHTEENMSEGGDLRTETEITKDIVESESDSCKATSCMSCDRSTTVESSHAAAIDHLEKIWTRSLSLAEKIGISTQKVIALKSF